MKRAHKVWRLVILGAAALILLQCNIGRESPPRVEPSAPIQAAPEQPLPDAAPESPQFSFSLPEGNALAMLRSDGMLFLYTPENFFRPVNQRVAVGESFAWAADQVQTSPHYLLTWQTWPAEEGVTLITSNGQMRFIPAPAEQRFVQQVFASPRRDRLFWLYDASPMPVNLISPCNENPACPGYVFELFSSDLRGQDVQRVARIETGVRNFGLRMRFGGWDSSQNALRLIAYMPIPSVHYLAERGIVYEIQPASGKVIAYGDISQGMLLSPDGLWQANAFWGEQTVFEVSKLQGGRPQPQELLYGEETIIEQLTFSPSGQRLAWIAMQWDDAQRKPQALTLQVMEMVSGRVQNLELPVSGKSGDLDLPYLSTWLNENEVVVNTNTGSRIFNTATMSWNTEWDSILHSGGDYLALGILEQPVTLPSVRAQAALASNEGLFLLDADTNEIKKVSSEAPAGMAAHGNWLAYSSAAYGTGKSTLHLLNVANGQVIDITSLYPAGFDSNMEGELCTPEFEATRAPFIGQGLAWSPDGSQLAFISAHESTSAEIYLYTLANGRIRKVTETAGQLYDLHWSPDGRYLTAFAANCFGTGAGFAMTGAWAVELNTGNQFEPFVFDPAQVEGLAFHGWLDDHTFLISDWSSFCGEKNLRRVDIAQRTETSLIPGCAGSLTLSGDSRTAAYTVVDYAVKDPAQAGFFLMSLEDGSVILHEPKLEAAHILYEPTLNQFLVRSWQNEILSFTMFGSQGDYQGRGELPVFTPNGTAWAAADINGVTLQTLLDAAPRSLTSQQSSLAFWGPDGSLFFFAGEDAYAESLNLYRASPPEFTPQLIAEGVSRPYSGSDLFWFWR